MFFQAPPSPQSCSPRQQLSSFQIIFFQFKNEIGSPSDQALTQLFSHKNRKNKRNTNISSKFLLRKFSTKNHFEQSHCFLSVSVVLFKKKGIRLYSQKEAIIPPSTIPLALYFNQSLQALTPFLIENRRKKNQSNFETLSYTNLLTRLNASHSSPLSPLLTHSTTFPSFFFIFNERQYPFVLYSCTFVLQCSVFSAKDQVEIVQKFAHFDIIPLFLAFQICGLVIAHPIPRTTVC